MQIADIGILEHIDPSQLDYSEWLAVGMAAKNEGWTAADWDAWSRRDPSRYVPGLCERKWAGFNGSAAPVTAGTLYEFAKRQGWQPATKREYRALDWDDEIGGHDDLRVIDPTWVEDAVVEAPTASAAAQIVTYLSTLFEASEYVGYVTESWKDGERYLPKKGSYSRTAGELIHQLSTCRGDIGAVLGDYNQEAGAWIRFNPLDGKGVRDDNVTAYRYALIESDTQTIERQAAIYAELELPIAALVHSGKKSLHAIVRINATSKEEYRDRVNFLHEVCKKNDLVIDTQNKNPSRLSRLPGVMRNGHQQYLVSTNQGKASWEEWKAHIEQANDNLPDIEQLADVINALPPLAAPLIDGILRQGHKMLLAGPSKAGKSYILLELAIAIAEGVPWLGHRCAAGRVLYVNLELDKASCFHRLATLYQAMGLRTGSAANIDIWNLRGKAVPMDTLAPKLIRRALKRQYKAVIIDPIYKVLTGSENEADEMSHFCNQFDRVCAELGAATIYCHHHSKGSQGQKNSRDRSSGSGVFARDPDAILDLIELNIEDSRRKQLANREVCAAVRAWLNANHAGWQEHISQDTALHADDFATAAYRLGCHDKTAFDAAVDGARDAAGMMSGWRMEATLREFPTFPAKRLFFRYPIHILDDGDLLLDAKADGEEAPWEGRRREHKGDKPATQAESLEAAFESAATFAPDEPVMVGDLAEQQGKSPADIRRLLKKTRLIVGDDDVVRTQTDHATHLWSAAFEASKDLNGYVKLADFAAALGKTPQGIRRQSEKRGYEIKAGYILRAEGE